LESISQLSAKYNLIGYYVYAPSEDKKVDATTRMFAPYYGIEEEAATGMAAGPLACFLYDREHKKQKQFIMEQGKFMAIPSPNRLHVHLTIEEGKIIQLFAGGDAYVSGERIVDI
jgi:PhzF family phenazine biosynthesis protein